MRALCCVNCNEKNNNKNPYLLIFLYKKNLRSLSLFQHYTTNNIHLNSTDHQATKNNDFIFIFFSCKLTFLFTLRDFARSLYNLIPSDSDTSTTTTRISKKNTKKCFFFISINNSTLNKNCIFVPFNTEDIKNNG